MDFKQNFLLSLIFIGPLQFSNKMLTNVPFYEMVASVVTSRFLQYVSWQVSNMTDSPAGSSCKHRQISPATSGGERARHYPFSKTVKSFKLHREPERATSSTIRRQEVRMGDSSEKILFGQSVRHRFGQRKEIKYISFFALIKKIYKKIQANGKNGKMLIVLLT